MTCTTCHDPHAPASGDEAERRYVEACRQCHGGPLSAASHAGRNDCVECHMPKRRTEDVVHAVVTDHLIQRRKPAGDLLAERAERRDEYRGEVVLYYPESLAVGADAELYLAVAQVKQKSNLKPGIARLTAAIAKYRPQRAEWYFELAEALEHDGQLAKAVASYREAVKRDAAWPVAWQRLGTVLRRASRREEAVTALRRSLTLAPERALTWHELGLTFQSMGRRAEAVDALRKAIARDADFAEAHSNLGILLAAGGDGAAAERSFREAVRIQPNYADARGNLANVLASSGRRAEAVVEFESALKFRPADAGTRYNYALALGGLGRYEDAQRELEACLRADGKFTDAHELLGDLLLARSKAGEAASHFREAVAQRPASARANLGLGIALAAAGDRAGAMASLRKAAAGTDEEVRKRAMELLRQLGAEK